MKTRLAVLLLVALVGEAPRSAPAADVVRVGAYYFPPYVEGREGPVRGLAADLLTLLNAAQDEYRFEAVRTTPTGRYADFTEGRFDLVAFEDAAWGWQGYPVEASRVFLEGAEVYVTRAGTGRDQRYFDDLRRKRLAVLRGYHYGFAGLEADPAGLRARFDIHLGDDHRDTVARVLDGRSDVAVVTRAWLDRLLRDDPTLGPRLLVSERPDQRYRFSILVRARARPTVEWIDRLLDRLEAQGALATLGRRRAAE